MKAYTIMSLDIVPDEPIDGTVVGTYQDRRRAIEECADYIIERVRLRTDVRYAIMHDLNHPELPCILEDEAGLSENEIEDLFSYELKEDWDMSQEAEASIKRWLVDSLCPGGYYEIEVDFTDDVIGGHEFVFKVIENDFTGGN